MKNPIIFFKDLVIRCYMHYLCKCFGFKPVRANSWIKVLKNDYFGADSKLPLTKKQKHWLHKNGFAYNRWFMQNLREDNIHLFLSDFDYWRMMPLSNHFNRWIDDKLTLRYVLEPFKQYLPAYYCVITTTGNKVKLIDSPTDIKFDDDYFLHIVERYKILAMKPLSGAEGKGFIKYTYQDGEFFMNDIKMTESEVRTFFKDVKDLLITEYVVQCKEHMKVCSMSSCTLRINSIKEVGEKPYLMHSFARFGTKESGAVSNLMSGGVSIAYDSYTGYYADRFLHAKDYIAWYDEHPESHISLKGKQLPHWELIRDKLIEMHEFLGVIEYMAFDVIVTDDGFKICEINSGPSVSYGQAMCYPIYSNEQTASFFNKRLKGPRRNDSKKY